MAKRVIIVFLLAFLFIGVSKAEAGVIINEVKYSPTTKQWVEIYNDTDNSVDITTYKILDSGAATNGHSISAFNNGSNLILAHSFGVVAKVPEDFGAVSFPVFKSPLNIKVSSDNVVLRNESGENVSSVGIDGTAVDGNSFQLIGGVWEIAVPTPGIQNSITDNTVASSSSGTITNTNTNLNNTNIEVKPKIVEVPRIKTKIIAKNLAFANISIEFQAQNTGYSGETLYYGKNFWNFGDGDSKEQIGNFDKFTHTYYYPGQYVVTLDYYSNSYSEGVPDAVNKTAIDVVPVNILISKVGDDKDFFVEITNGSDYEMNISKWALSSFDKTFTLPQNTIISSKGKIILSPKITGFSLGDESGLKLFNREGKVVYEYTSSVVPQDEIKKVISAGTKKSITNQTKNDIESISSVLSQKEGDIVLNKEEQKGSFWFFVGFAILLLASSGAVYFIRRKKVSSSFGDDFQILDE